jgi:hypothetical protein
MTPETQPLDTWPLTHLQAQHAIAELPADSDWDAIRERERTREKGPRPSVMRALDQRDPPDREAEVEVEAVDPPSAQLAGELPPESWTTHSWRGHRLHKCRHCAYETFEVGRIYAHQQRRHPQR